MTPEPLVLVVDDEPAIREVEKRFLRKGGYRVIEAAGAGEAFAVLKQTAALDLLIADLDMPEIPGDEMVRQIRSARPDLKVLYVTAHIDRLLDVRATLWEGEAFLDKPFTSKGLLEAVSLLLRGTLTILVMGMLLWAAPAFADGTQPPQATPKVVIVNPPATRPTVLIPLYVSLAGLQAYDGYTTIRGVRAGATETNPLVGGLAKQPVAFWTLKALSTVTTIYFTEQLWRQHKRRQAIMTMVVANAVMGAVAARNAQIVSQR
jgi:CheY-like chemotaxis protein